MGEHGGKRDLQVVAADVFADALVEPISRPGLAFREDVRQ
jgi:hypothetical protein